MTSTPIEFRCQHCGRRLRIGRGKLGKRVACPRCKQKTDVVLDEEVSAAEELPNSVHPAAPPQSSGEEVPIQLVHDRSVSPSNAATNAAAGTDTNGANAASSSDEPTFSLTKPTVLALAVLVVALPVGGFGLGWLAGRAAPVVQASRSRQPAFFSGEVVDASGAPERNAVVLLFSERTAPQSSDRLVVETLRPSATPLKPTDQVVRDMRTFDADTTRTDEQGRFTVRAPDTGSYYLLVVSTKQNSRVSVIPRSDIAQIGRYVDRPADLIRNQRYHWRPIEIKSDQFEHVVKMP